MLGMLRTCCVRLPLCCMLCPAFDLRDRKLSEPAAFDEDTPAAGNRGRGRPKGSRNKRSLTLQEKLAALRFDPVTALARIAMNRKNPVELRLKAAAEAAPYVHAKLRLSEVAVTGADRGPLEVRTSGSDVSKLDSSPGASRSCLPITAKKARAFSPQYQGRI